MATSRASLGAIIRANDRGLQQFCQVGIFDLPTSLHPWG